jgi:hypothetical protein
MHEPAPPTQQFALRYALGDIVLFRAYWPALIKEFSLSEILPTSATAPDTAPDAKLARVHRAGPTICEQPAIQQSGRWLHYTYAVYPRFFIELSGGYEKYLAKFSSKKRFNLRREHKLFVSLSDEGATTFSIATTPDDMARFRQEARVVASKTYQEKLWGAAVPEADDFWQRMTDKASKGDFMGAIAYVNGVPVSYALCQILDNVAELLYIGYDPAFQKHSPGSVLLWHIIEQVFSQPRLAYFDFGEGYADYKKTLSTGCIQCGNTLITSASIKNMLLLRGHMGLTKAARRAGELLDEWGWKKRIRQLLRRG